MYGIPESVGESHIFGHPQSLSIVAALFELEAVSQPAKINSCTSIIRFQSGSPTQRLVNFFGTRTIFVRT